MESLRFQMSFWRFSKILDIILKILEVLEVILKIIKES